MIVRYSARRDDLRVEKFDPPFTLFPPAFGCLVDRLWIQPDVNCELSPASTEKFDPEVCKSFAGLREDPSSPSLAGGARANTAGETNRLL